MPGRRRLVGFLCTIALCAAPEARAATESPFRVPSEEVVGKLRTVALAPLWVPDELIVDRVDRERMLELVTRQLREAGISVVPPSRTEPILEAIKTARGSYRDAAGKIDLERYYAYQREAVKALQEDTGADQLLLVSLSVTEAVVSAGRASWDGVEEPAAVPEQRSCTTDHDKLWALSVGAWLHGDGGRLLYRQMGGLRLLFHLGRDQKRVPVVDADLLADDDRNARAVRLALEPLLAPLAPSPTARVERGPAGRTP